ncbi:MAG TPA: protein phosphatase 2C domain-containing protein [Micropepsaceae bacterium]|nr:protein phosphatase 2C domain-containing protein [Micropepsaceae bacterium]
MTFRSVARTHPGAVRERNEDAVLERAGVGIWAVSDGMGGHDSGEVASAFVIDCLIAIAPSGGNPLTMAAVRDALVRSNDELYRHSSSLAPDRMMGATLAVLGLDAQHFFCLWAGDSRLYRYRGGRLTQLSRDHSYVQTLIDSGLLDEKEAENHPRRSVITRAFGVGPELVLDQCQGPVEAGDIFLLVTDGVTRVCKDADIANILSRSGLDEAAEAIVALCLERGAPDNLSLVLVAAGS